MAHSYRERKNYSDGVVISAPRRNWGLLVSVALMVLGMLVLLLNLPSPHHAPASTSILVHDGLIVEGTGSKFYLFKNYTLHPISSPTLEQQSQAQWVEDDFLAQFTCAEPVDYQGRPL